jgi:hypothetical protein
VKNVTYSFEINRIGAYNRIISSKFNCLESVVWVLVSGLHFSRVIAFISV